MLLLNSISKYRPAICSLISPFSDAFTPKETLPSLPTSLSELYLPEHEELTYRQLLRVRGGLNISIKEDEISLIENSTTQQRRTAAWYTQRCGWITAFTMKAVCSTISKKPSINLIHQICYPLESSFSTEATRWGCEHEPAAREAYISYMKKDHLNFTCRESGFFISKTHNFIRASPDGYCYCDCCGCGVLEVKCPYCIRGSDPETSPYLESCSLKRNHAYYYQLQTQLFACNASNTDFQLCTFVEEEETINFILERVSFDQTFFNECLEKAEHFFQHCILPELVGKWFTRNLVIPSDFESEDCDSSY